MFSVLRRLLLRKPCLYLQSCSVQFESSFIDRRIIFTSSLTSSGFLYNVVRRGLSSKPYPDHVLVKLPALSPTMEKGNIASWAKKEGDAVNEGDVIAEVETDKATMAVEADDSGFVAKILVPSGAKGIRVGTPICILVDKQEHIGAFKDYKGSEEAPPPKAPAAQAPASSPTASSPAASSPATSASRESPKKKFKGKRQMFDDKKDVTPKSATLPPPKSAVQAEPGAKFTDIPTTSIRQVIAQRLLQSKQQIPHFYLGLDVDTEQMEAMRKMLNAELAKNGIKISVNDIVVKASALACRKVPEVNSSWMNENIRQYHTVDVSVAVSTPTGLITPIVFNADTKQMRDISTEMKDLAKKARLGKLQPKEFQGGTFTVSNLGMYGIHDFCAIINPPQSCILAVGSPGERLYMKEGVINSIRVKKYVTVTLSCDHRVVDGVVGAQWLQAFKNYMEDPKTMF